MKQAANLKLDPMHMSEGDVRTLAVNLLVQVAAQEQTIQELRDEIARLKKLPKRPKVKPSSLPKDSEDTEGDKSANKKRTRGTKTPKNGASYEDRVIKAENLPEGSRLKGYEDFVVQDLVIRTQVIRYRRERWETPGGETLVAPLPSEVKGHFGPELKRFVLSQYHHGQVTIPRIHAQLEDIGIRISKRHIVRLLNEGHEGFHAEKKEILQVGLETASWVTTDDTGARHKATNHYCTHIGNDLFAWFGTTDSKSRQNFLELLQAGAHGYVINEEALSYMAEHGLSEATRALLGDHPQRSFSNQESWEAHLRELGILAEGKADRETRIATEGGLVGHIAEQGILQGTAIVSDGAGQFAVLLHARCWIHAERNIRKLVPVTSLQKQLLAMVLTLIWGFYGCLKAFKKAPCDSEREILEARFDWIFSLVTGYEELDAALNRLRSKKKELLLVLERPEIPLHTNGSENDIRTQVTKRKVSGGTRSDLGKECRDTFLSLLKTCHKHGLSFWDFLGHRLDVVGVPEVPKLSDLIRQRTGVSAF